MTKAKKMTSAFIAAAAMLICALFVVLPQTTAHAADAWDGTTIATAFAGGDGTSEATAYEISAPAELAYLAQQVNAGTDYSGEYFKLTADIDLGGKEWTPIASANSFAGTFSGDGHVIKNISVADVANAGLFGNNDGTIMNVGIEGGNVSGTRYAGGVCAQNYGTISNCYNTADVMVTSSYGNAGGICGYNESSLSYCYNTGTVSAIGEYTYVGGICGYNFYYENEDYSDSPRYIKYCYNAGVITGGETMGSICGMDNFGPQNCYYLEGTAEYANNMMDMGEIRSYVTNPKSLSELYALDIDGESNTAWAAGSVTAGTANGRFRTDTHTLPYLTVFGEDSAPSLTADKYNFGYNGSDDWQEYTPITTAAELQAINDDLSGNYVLMNDIDLDNVEWTPIGTIYDGFTGKFSGNGHVIENISVSSGTYVGLFVNNDGLIMNVGIESGSISGSYPGGICAHNNDTVFGCYNNANITGSYQYVGGICYTNYGTIDNCLNSGSVTNTSVNANLTNIAGGIAGCQSYNNIISNCLNIGSVSAEDEASAICGSDGTNGTGITNCYYLDSTAEHASYYNNYGTDSYYDTGKKTLAELCALDIDGNGTLWAAGNATAGTANGRFRTDTHTLPYLTVFGEDNAKSLTADKYNFNYDGTDDWQEYTPISTADELQAIKDDLDGNYVLTDDIDLDGVTWTPIGNNTTHFTGKFSGNGHTISNLNITGTEAYQGLFGKSEGLIMNVTVEGAVSGSADVGGICGFNSENGVISGCTSDVAITATGSHIGGVCGANNGTIENCANLNDVTSTGNTGGIVGSTNGDVKNCYNTGDISSDSRVGGICGFAGGGTIENCYNTGDIDGTQYVGGISGTYDGATFNNCYSVGKVGGENATNIGGAFGFGYGNNNYCYYCTDIVSIDNGYGTKTTLAELCGTLPSGFSSAVWSAGSASFAASDVTVDENNERMGTADMKLPYLTNVGTQQTFAVDVYNFSLTDTPDWQLYTPITTAAQLQAVNDDLDGNYVLMNDIDLDGVAFTPIGGFTGKFSGNSKVVKNLTITTQDNYIGLFGINRGLIMNLGVEGTVTSSGYYVGGIVGLNYGTISGCYFKGDVSAQAQQGGIVGWNAQEGIVDNCFAIGGVTGSGNYAGGIVGVNDGTISHSYCASTVTLTGEYTDKGGVCALNVGTITNCFYNKDIYTDEDSTVGVEGLSTLDMTAADVLETMGFDSDIWAKTDNDKASGTAYYPYLKAFEEITAPSISYETKRTLAYDDEKAAPVYGESLFFEISALVKFDGMNDFVPVKGGYAKGAGSFKLQCGGEDITESFDIYDGAEVQLEYIKGDIGAGERTFILVYSADGSDFFAADGTADCTVTIAKAEYTGLPAIPVVTDSYTYGTTLSEISLGDSEWTWAEPDIIPDAGTYSGVVVFTPDADTIANYKVEDIDGWNADSMHFEAYIEFVVTEAVIDSITVSFDAPVPEQAFDTTAEVAENGILNAAINWCTNIDGTQQDVTDSIAQYSGEYWAIVTIEADHNHIFANEVSITAPTDDTFYDIINGYKCVSLTVNFGKLPKGEVAAIQLTAPTQTEYYCGDELDLTGGYIIVTYKGGETENIDLTADMVSGFNSTTAGTKTVIVTYGGKTASFEVTVRNYTSAPPCISPENTTFKGSVKISMTVPELGSDSVIYYTTDGSEPTTSSTVYTGPFTITKQTTIKAFAIYMDYEPSAIVTVTYKPAPSGGGGGGGGSSGGGGGSSGGSSAAKGPTLNGFEMTWNAIAKEITEMADKTAAEIELNGNYDVPVDVIKAIADNDIKVTFIVDDSRSWLVDGADIAVPKAADLSILTIASVNASSLRGTLGSRFTLDGAGIPAKLSMNYSKRHAGKFANLYMLMDGKLVFVDNVKVDANGDVILSASEKGGDHVIMLCEYSDRKGDINNDGVVNALDAAAILTDIVGLAAAPNPMMADFNDDGSKNALDASAILLAIVNAAA